MSGRGLDRVTGSLVDQASRRRVLRGMVGFIAGVAAIGGIAEASADPDFGPDIATAGNGGDSLVVNAPGSGPIGTQSIDASGGSYNNSTTTDVDVNVDIDDRDVSIRDSILQDVDERGRGPAVASGQVTDDVDVRGGFPF